MLEHTKKKHKQQMVHEKHENKHNTAKKVKKKISKAQNANNAAQQQQDETYFVTSMWHNFVLKQIFLYFTFFVMSTQRAEVKMW